MGFSTGGSSSSIAGSSDVSLSNPTASNFLSYNSSVSKWQNATLSGYAALATNGGAETIVTNSSASGSVTLNISGGNVFNVTLAGNTTFIFSGAIAGKACSISLYITHDSAGTASTAWGSTVLWSGGIAPTLSNTANAVDILVFESLNGGSSWYGSLVGTNFS